VTGKECDRILDGLIVGERGELVLDESFREHLDECASCRAIYDRIESAKKGEVPDYVPAVMRRIRQMDTVPASVGWARRLRRLRGFITVVFRPRVLIPAAATIVIAVIVLSFALHLFPAEDRMDEFAHTRVLSGIGDIDKRRSVAIDRVISNNIQFALLDSESRM